MKTVACYSEKISQIKSKDEFVKSKQFSKNRKCFGTSNVGYSCVD